MEGFVSAVVMSTNTIYFLHPYDTQDALEQVILIMMKSVRYPFYGNNFEQT